MIGPDGFDHFNEDDFNYDDVPLGMHPPEIGSVTINAQPGDVIHLFGSISLSVIAKGNLMVLQKTVENPEPAAADDPKDLLWTPIARVIMSPARYHGEWLQHLSDMNAERHECLKRGNRLGAHVAVIRAHFYSLPVSWLLLPVRFALHLLKHWWGF